MTVLDDRALGDAKTQAYLTKTFDGSGTDPLELVAATAGVQTRLLQAVISVAAAQVVSIKVGSTTIMTLHLAANDRHVLPFSPLGWATTAANEALNLQGFGTSLLATISFTTMAIT